MPRRRSLHAILFLLAVLAPSACLASQFTLVNGNFSFSVPDGWPRIMQTRGDPETMVFQVPDTSPSRQESLARVSVTSKQVRDLTAFQAFVAEDTAHAQALPGFQLDKQRSTPTAYYYTATEGSAEQTFTAHYYFHDGYAVQVRCVRPSHSQAGNEWTRAFDEGCARITSSLR